MKTTAEKIADLLDNDGQNFETDDGRILGDLLIGEGAVLKWSNKYAATRYTLPDGSSITIAGPAWDLGYPDCFCWQGVGHTDDCTDPSFGGTIQRDPQG